MELRSEKKITLDPRTKILLIILCNVLIFTYGNALYLHIATVLGILLTILLGKTKPALKMACCYVLLYTMTFLVSYMPKMISSFWGMAILPLIFFFPLFAFGFLLFTTTEVSEVITALQKMKVPSVVITPLIVMFRFFPTLKIELHAIRDAMKLKGVRKNPIKLLEYVYAPILFNCVTISEELNISGVTRGLGLHKTSTQTAQIRFTLLDVLSVCLMVGLILLRKEVITI